MRYRPGASPVVVFESGLGLPSSLWRAVWEQLPAEWGLLCYDRAGLGGSAAAGGERSAQVQARELRQLLERLHVAPPYVLVGHSAGAFVVRLFAAEHPGETAGVVLVDPSQELDRQPTAVGDGVVNAALHILSLLAATAPWAALVRRARAAGERWPGRVVRRLSLLAELCTPAHLRGVLQENQAYRSSVEQVRRSGLPPAPGDLPVRVVTAAPRSANRRVPGRPGQPRPPDADVVATDRSMQLLAVGSGHLIPVDAPAVVAEAVRQVVLGAARRE